MYFYLALVCLFHQKKYTSVFLSWNFYPGLVCFIQKERIHWTSVLSFSAVVDDCGFKPWPCQMKDYKIGICCFSAKLQHQGERAKTGWLGIRIMCLSARGATYLSTDLFHWVSTIKIQACWCSSKLTSSSPHWKLTCFRNDMQ